MALQKIVHLTQAGGIGGVMRVIRALADFQIRQGCEVVVGLPSRFDSPEFRNWTALEGKLYLAPFIDRQERSYHTRFAELVSWLRCHAPDVLHVHSGSHLIHPRYPLAARLARIRRVVTTVHHLPTAFAVSSAERFMTQLGASLSDRVVVTSDVMRIGLQSIGLPESKLVRIPVPVLTPGGVTRDSVAEVRSRYGLLPSAFLVGNTSRFAIHKGQLNLVKAVHLASAQCANLHLVLVGYGRRREEIQKYVVENCPKLVTFLQIDTELGDYYRALDLFAHLPSEEGFGIVYAEAALMGIASLGTRVGGVPIAIEDGVTGFLVEFGDIAVAADRIILACRNQKQLREMGVCARKRAQQEFNPERICQSYHQLYMR